MPKETYQFAVEKGDIVEMPCGTMGIISGDEFVCGGNCRAVTVFPFANWLYRLFLVMTGRNSFCDEQINRLKPIHRVPWQNRKNR